MPEDRYPKDNILQVPVLKPERRYYSEGVLTGNDYYLVPTEPNQFFKTIDDLDGVYEMANLLPPDLAEIIQRVTNILSIDSQGKLILRMENEKEQPSQPDNNEPGKEEEPEDNQRDVTPSPDPEEEEDDGLFSRKPAFTITVEPSVSLVDLAHSSYEQDDLDIKNDYIQKMNSISSRYFSIMTTLAIEAGMPDYSYLLQDFDGTAVTTSDPNQQHLIDLICKQQILYDQKLRQMNLIHTAENTLIMTRGMTAAEGQRERYLDEKYKENLPDNASAMSNDLLQKSREEADKRYQDSAYNMYKYLDSATKFTNALLNLKIDEA